MPPYGPGYEQVPLAARRRRLPVVLVAAVVFAVVVGAVAAAFLVTGLNDEVGVTPTVTSGEHEDPVTPEPPASCAGDERHRAAGEAKHVAAPLEETGLPPHSGPHAPAPLRNHLVVEPGSEAENAAGRAVHNLEHGYVVVWFEPRPEVFAQVTTAVARSGVPKVVAVPWDGDLSAPVVLAAWRVTQACEVVSSDAVRAFFAEHGADRGLAPEPLAP